MAWQYGQAQQRIRKLIDEAPEIDVRRFADEYMPLYEARKAVLKAANESVAPPLFDLQKGRAVVVDTVQIYIAITNYDDYRIEEGRETEASHAKALRFLHLYYSTCDRVIEQTDAQRVDFHGSRMHAVVLNPDGDEGRHDSLLKALSFIRDFRVVADQANRELAESDLDAVFRIGVDIGPCVAINNGNGLEQEPMFLGSSANHAAKLAYGDEPGIFLSDRARAVLDQPAVGPLETLVKLDEDVFRGIIDLRDEVTASSGVLRDPQVILKEWRDEITAKSLPDPTIPDFVFHYKEPPLNDIKFADLMPSSSIRMGLASLFADLTGYTAYIDNAIAAGSIADAVKALYVVRQELQNVVEDDFGGRKIRFIGDCIHGVVAEGSRTETEPNETVAISLVCAGGLRSSFAICKAELHGIGDLGLTIGIEFGPTPITRIGIRGERSVRLASSIATATSEKVQRGCDDDQIQLGPEAQKLIPVALEDLIDANGTACDLTHDDVITGLSLDTTVPAAPAYHRAHSPADTGVPRAHFTPR